MSIRLYKSYTPGTRNRAISAFTEITKNKPEKKLIHKNHRTKDEIIKVLLLFVIEEVVISESIE